MDARLATAVGAGPRGATGGNAGIGIDSVAFIGPAAHERMQSALHGLTAEDDRVDGAPVLRYRVPADRLRVFLGVLADSPQTSLGRIEGESMLWVTKETGLSVRLQTTATPSTGGTVLIEAHIRDRNGPAEVPPSGRLGQRLCC